jgi:hypothetical protein
LLRDDCNVTLSPDNNPFVDARLVIHAYAKAGGAGSAKKAQELLENMQKMYQQGNPTAKPDTITVSSTRIQFE